MMDIKQIADMIKKISPNEPATPVQKHIVMTNAAIGPDNDFDLMAFCLERRIDISSFKVSRLLQFGKSKLEEFWDVCSNEFPNELVGLTDPELLLSKVGSFYSARRQAGQDIPKNMGGR